MAQKKQQSFESSLERLGEIVRTLEKGDAPLADSLKLFEEGAGLVHSTADGVLKFRLDVRINKTVAMEALGSGSAGGVWLPLCRGRGRRRLR